ncbi:MAG TPA: metallophosphoesterase [Polyangiaceae bacterium]|nr:metallophosphoesterase [Polyangiaceae bacterium]
MARRQRLPEALWAGLLWVIAWGVAWALLVMERILELREGPPRTALVLFGMLLVVGSAPWATRALARSGLRYLPLLVLGVIAVREGFRAALRRQYVASAPVKRVELAESLWHPVTTTDLALSYYVLGAPQLEAERLRIVALSDLHVSHALPGDYYARVRASIAAQDPDLILLSGDYVSRSENVELLARVFAPRWPARFGVFAVLGNHDFWANSAGIRDTLSAAGVTLLENRCWHLPRGVGRVALCGTEAPWGAELSAELDRSELNIVLSHTPDNVYHLATQGASLVFAGHTHGGQMRVPGLGSLVVPSRYGRIFDQGHFRVNGTDLFVSAGIGADAPALRVYCPPEMFVVDVRRE